MTRGTGQASARFRQRKLTTKQPLQILSEDKIEAVDEDGQRNVPKVETGVEKGEEIEHHLQAALSASQAAAVGGKVAQIYIPTPDTIHSSIQYGRLYPLPFPQPATYIRFSSTVEDCCGCPYDMDDDDETFLKSFNSTRDVASQCSEDQFEEVMDFFEQTAQVKQPYASVDSPPVLTYEDMESAFEETLNDFAKHFAKEIYGHWKTRRVMTSNKPLIAGLKFETGAETDDSDPYVCFRRRESRQVRKTRGRDAHSAEKLKKLRKELEESRQIMALIRQREITKREQLNIEKQLFEQRSRLKQGKRNLPDPHKEGDEDLLINQKPQKKKPLELNTHQISGTQLRLPQRSDMRTAEADLLSLKEVLADSEKQLQAEIELRISQHQKRSQGYVDMTREPLTPSSEKNTTSNFRTATTEYLPTPPASVSSEPTGDNVVQTDSSHSAKDDIVTVRYASPSYDGHYGTQPSFRRRIGRGGRLIIDRRGMHIQSEERRNDIVADRMKFDTEDDEDDEIPVYEVDPYDVKAMRFRAKIVSMRIQPEEFDNNPHRKPSVFGLPNQSRQPAVD
ncbi:MAG: hypothetical protein LQ342_000732 [Letrouitia transgressa]|nr:MAG: hypothetical protein LQ342_000732 [Letrouitia transgressa]